MIPFFFSAETLRCARRSRRSCPALSRHLRPMSQSLPTTYKDECRFKLACLLPGLPASFHAKRARCGSWGSVHVFDSWSTVDGLVTWVSEGLEERPFFPYGMSCFLTDSFESIACLLQRLGTRSGSCSVLCISYCCSARRPGRLMFVRSIGYI
jgi:hypothetical protein